MRERLIEDDLVKAASHFLPFVTRRRWEALRVCVKSLMKESHQQERAVATSGREFRQTLQHEHILALWPLRRIFQQLSQFVDNQQDAGAFLAGVRSKRIGESLEMHSLS